MKNRYKAIIFILIVFLLILNTKYYEKMILGGNSTSWIGAGFSLDHVFYTAYLEMTFQDGILETVDWQANNPGYKAKITGIDQNYIYIKVLEADGYPADWELKTQDKIRYEYVSKYELRLTYNGTTCIFFRENDLSHDQIKELKKFVNHNWVAQDSSNLSASFSYFDFELFDVAKQSEDKIVFSGRTYFNTQDSTIDMVPDITIVKDANPILPGIEREEIAHLHYRFSEDGKTLTLVYNGKEVVFKNRNGG